MVNKDEEGEATCRLEQSVATQGEIWRNNLVIEAPYANNSYKFDYQDYIVPKTEIEYVVRDGESQIYGKPNPRALVGHMRQECIASAEPKQGCEERQVRYDIGQNQCQQGCFTPPKMLLNN